MNDYDIAEIYKDMELHLIRSMRRNLGRHLEEEAAEGFKWKAWQAEKLKELKRYQRQNKDIINSYTRGLPDDISKILKDEFKQGAKHEINRYNELFDKNMADSFFKLDDRKANALIKVVNNDLKKGNQACLRMINDVYRKTIYRAATFATTGTMTTKQAVDMATKDFLNKGLDVIEYKDGRRVNIASYSQMAVRTASQRAMLMGEAEFRKEMGEYLVIISRHGTACELCKPHETKVYVDDVYANGKPDGKHRLLSEAMEEGLFHPNCRHGVNTFYDLDGVDEAAPIDDVPVDNDNPEVSRIDVAMRKEQRKIEGCQDKGNVDKAKAKLKELEAEKEAVIFEPKNVLGNKVDFSTLNLEDARNKQIKDDLTALTKEYNTRLNSVSFHSQKEIKAAGDVDLSGNMRLATKSKTTYTHEFAHSITQSRLVKYDLGNETDAAFWDEANKLFKEYKKEIRDLSKNEPLKVYEIKISDYSLENVDEFIAEGFARAKLDGTDAIAKDYAYNNKVLSPYATKVLNLINKYFKR